MKEVSIEEKARAYDEALERVKELLSRCRNNRDRITMVYRVNDIESIFPELKKSEDEKIKEDLIEWISDFPDMIWSGHYKKDVIAWLEKQGEQKQDVNVQINPSEYINNIGGNGCYLKNATQTSTWSKKEEKVDNQNCVKSVDDIKPKFKVGDWISNDMCDVHIASIENGMYYFDEGDGLSIVFVDEHYHLWTIEDAMDGDVLCCESGWTCIFKALNSDNISFSSYCFMDNTGWFCETGSESHTLEKAFIKAYNGEIYPATKEQRDILFQKMKKEGYVWDSQEKELRKVEQNPTEWSDEDERNMQNIDAVLFYDRKLPEDTCVKLRNFLKTLKERVQPQYLTITNEELVQAKKEAYNDALDKIEYHSDTPTFNDGWSAAIWYLKKRTTQPQSTWKPSEEQMSSLRGVVNSLPHEQVLFTLYNDLRKLKGE